MQREGSQERESIYRDREFESSFLQRRVGCEPVNRHRIGTLLQRGLPPWFDVENPLNRRVPIGADGDPTETLIIGIETTW
jgi:hypothetical protein